MNSKGRRNLRERKREIEAAAGELLALRNSTGPAKWAAHPEPTKAELHDDYEKLEKRREKNLPETPPPSLKSYRNE